MENDKTPSTEENTKGNDEAKMKKEPPGPGGKPVGVKAIIILATYLIAFSVFLLYSLFQFWPVANGETAEAIIRYFSFEFTIGYEVNLLIIVAMAGALGSQIHVLRSYWKYVGNRELVWSWTPLYILKPLIGATLGLVFYFIIRGGFFTSQTILDATPFGFAAMAALTGMFTDVMVEKLLIVLQTFFTTPKKERESLPDEEKPPVEGGKQKKD